LQATTSQYLNKANTINTTLIEQYANPNNMDAAFYQYTVHILAQSQ